MERVAPARGAASGRGREVSLGALDATDQLTPTYESWMVRREVWLPPFPLARRYERDRDATERAEGDVVTGARVESKAR